MSPYGQYCARYGGAPSKQVTRVLRDEIARKYST
jgi:hypothetical protein